MSTKANKTQVTCNLHVKCIKQNKTSLRALRVARNLSGSNDSWDVMTCCALVLCPRTSSQLPRPTQPLVEYNQLLKHLIKNSILKKILTFLISITKKWCLQGNTGANRNKCTAKSFILTTSQAESQQYLKKNQKNLGCQVRYKKLQNLRLLK